MPQNIHPQQQAPFSVLFSVPGSLVWGVNVFAETRVVWRDCSFFRLFWFCDSFRSICPSILAAHHSVHPRPHHPTSLRTNCANRSSLVSQFTHNLTSDEQRQQDQPLLSTERCQVAYVCERGSDGARCTSSNLVLCTILGVMVMASLSVLLQHSVVASCASSRYKDTAKRIGESVRSALAMDSKWVWTPKP